MTSHLRLLKTEYNCPILVSVLLALGLALSFSPIQLDTFISSYRVTDVDRLDRIGGTAVGVLRLTGEGPDEKKDWGRGGMSHFFDFGNAG